MSKASPYLEAALTRWSDRGTLIRREIDMMLDGLEVKGHFLEGLRGRVLQHRKEDAAQLTTARTEAWGQWDERLQRMQSWSAASSALKHISGRLHAWKSGSAWFDRVHGLLERYGQRLDRKAAALEQDLGRLAEQTREWTDGLLMKETEIRRYSQWDTLRPSEILIPASQKRLLMDYVYAQRDQEATLAREFKSVRGLANRTLERINRTEKLLADRADLSPGYFEIRKNQAFDLWRPLEKRFTQLRESALHQALLFEEGRTRLRWMYDTLQKMRVVQDAPAPKKPFLERLFKLENS